MGLKKKEIYEKIARKEISVNEGMALLKGMEGRNLSIGKNNSPTKIDTNSHQNAIGNPLCEKICQYLENQVKRLLSLTDTTTQLNKNFMELGISSTQLISMSKGIEKQIGIELYPTLFFEYQNISELASYFNDEYAKEFNIFFGRKSNTPQAEREVNNNSTKYIKTEIEKKSAGGKDIAVIGMAGKFAKSNSLDEFWENIETSRDLVTEIPENRWNHQKWFDPDKNSENKAYSKWGSFIDDIDKFDPVFFGIAPKEAIWLDPQTRHLLEIIYKTAEDAGYIQKIYGSNTGLYIGSCTHEYWDEIVRSHIPFKGYEYSSHAMSLSAGRISYTFDLQGPCIPIDNACASSLTALHLACKSLQDGSIQTAFVAGVNLIISPLHYVFLSRIQALSPTGRCYAFDKKANGYVPGEGIGAILLKPLEKAQNDGDNIHAIIKGSAINHIGKSNNPTSPRPEMQTKLLLAAWEDAQINPETITYIETHGTGTKLGDPIEITALKNAFKVYTNKENFCTLGSTKAHTGHLEGAAGMISVIKVILALKNKKIPFMPNFEELNPFVTLKDSPFKINTKLEEYNTLPTIPRRAGISSFGLPGNSAHVVIEEYERSDEKAVVSVAENFPGIFILSAKSNNQLKEYVKDFISFLNNRFAGDIHNLLYTMQMGRQHFSYRLSIVCTTVSDITLNLNNYINNIAGKNLRTGTTSKEQPADLSKIDKKNRAKIAELWVKGGKIDWTILYPAAKLQIISLPTYPFKKISCWFPKESSQENSKKEKVESIHPLLTKNISTSKEKKISTQFYGDAPFSSLTDVERVQVFSMGKIDSNIESSSKLYFHTNWEEQKPGITSHIPEQKANTLIICEKQRLHDVLGNQESKYSNTIFIRPGEKYIKEDKNHFIIDLDNYENYSKLLDELNEKKQIPKKIIYYWNSTIELSNENSVNSILEKGFYSVCFLTKAMMKYKVKGDIRLVFLYEGEEDNINSLYSALEGLFKSINMENSKFRYKLIKIKNILTTDLMGIAEQELMLPENKATAIKYDGQTRYIKTWKKLSPIPSYKENLFLKENGVYLITGGVGVLGLFFTEYIGFKQKCTIILAGRSPLNEEKKLKINALNNNKSTIIYLQADVSIQSEIEKLLATIKSEYNKLDGIIHAAGVTRDSYLINKDLSQMKAVLNPKVNGTIFLDIATKNEKLDFYILFSGIAGAIGNAGQTDYSFANCFMDNYSLYRNNLVKAKKRFGETVSIIWPLWSGGGMKVDKQNREMLNQTTGMRPMPNKNGLDVFTQCSHLKVSPVLYFEGDSKKFEKRLGITDILTKTGVSKPRTKDIADEELLTILLDKLVNFITAISGINKEDIDLNTDMSEYGFDSMSFTAFTNKVNDTFQLDLTPANIYEHPSISDFGKYIYTRFKDKVINNCHSSESAYSTDFPAKHESITKIDYSVRLIPDVVNIVTDILGVKKEEVDVNVDISEYGFDSMSFTNFSNTLNSTYKIDITPAVIYEYPTITDFTEYLLSNYYDNFIKYYSGNTIQFKPTQECPDKICRIKKTKFKSQFTSQKRTSIIHEKKGSIAIIGAGGIFPKSDNPNLFWDNIAAGRDLISEVPGNHWDWRKYYGDPDAEVNKTTIKWGGFIDDIDKFDPIFFGISPREAELMDPQQRLFLEIVWNTIEDAGYKASSLAGSNTGIFVGVTNSDYNEIGREHSTHIAAHSAPGVSHPLIPNRVSYLLNFHGPSEPVNTACSSSLIAIHRAINAINNKECDLAIAGGINALLSTFAYVSLEKAGVLSEDGRCKTFDKEANGYVRSEGGGAVFLKPLSKAEQDGDYIYAIIRGSAVNHGGRAKSLTAPNPNAQADLVIAAYEEAGIDPSKVTYIETHGTGTKLGDPIEINGLINAFSTLYGKWGKSIPKDPTCGLGSVKTNIGHLESAAGIAGLIKILLSMKNKTLPGTVHFKEMNPFIRLNNSPFYIIKKTIPWKHLTDEKGNSIPYIAGISSFGFGGSNAHMVIEEYMGNDDIPGEALTESQLFILSAKSKEALSQYAKKMADFLSRTRGDLKTIAMVLQTGREAMTERLAIISKNREDLIQHLVNYHENKSGGFYSGNINNNKLSTNFLDGREGEEFIKIVMQERKLEKLASLWVSGFDINWDFLWTDENLLKTSLPTYPFEKKRYWLNIPSGIEKMVKSEPIQQQKEKIHIQQTSESPDLTNRKNIIQKRICRIVHELLLIDMKSIDENKNFDEMGLDSILTAQFVKNLNNGFKLSLRPITIFENPNLKTLTEYLSEELAHREDETDEEEGTI